MSRSRPSRPQVIHVRQLERSRTATPLADYEADLSVDGDRGRVVHFQARGKADALQAASKHAQGEEVVFEVRRIRGDGTKETVFDLFCTNTW